jgi:hypothetical protein
MNELPRFDAYGPAIERKRSSVTFRRKVAISTLVVLIIIVMIGWFGFLGWGLIEVLQQGIAIVKSL